MVCDTGMWQVHFCYSSGTSRTDPISSGETSHYPSSLRRSQLADDFLSSKTRMHVPHAYHRGWDLSSPTLISSVHLTLGSLSGEWQGGKRSLNLLLPSSNGYSGTIINKALIYKTWEKSLFISFNISKQLFLFLQATIFFCNFTHSCKVQTPASFLLWKCISECKRASRQPFTVRYTLKRDQSSDQAGTARLIATNMLKIGKRKRSPNCWHQKWSLFLTSPSLLEHYLY